VNNRGELSMNKKGAELSMNVIIISILVILVLVVVAFFFLGGTAKLFSGIKQFSPDNIEIAVGDCNSKCQLAQTYSNPTQIKTSGYCRKQVMVDGDGDDIADEIHRCYSNTIGVECPGVEEVCGYESVENIE